MTGHRLVKTADLSLDITPVSPDEIWSDAGGRHQLNQAPLDRDLKRVFDRLSERLSGQSVVTYAPWIRSYWQLVDTRKMDLADLALVRGWIAALMTGPHAIKPTSLRVAIAALNAVFSLLKKPLPSDDAGTRAWLRGLYRSKAQPLKQASPILAEDLIDLVDQAHARKDLRGTRDAAIMLLGWHCALRRSEICGLMIGDIAPAKRSKDFLVLIRKSKTDKVKEGQSIPLYRAKDRRLDAVAAIETWVSEAGIHNGPLFRSLGKSGDVSNDPLNPRSINYILKQYVMPKAGISAHSMRSGFVTEGGLQGIPLLNIMVTTRHKSIETARRYLRLIDPINQGTGPLI